MTNRSNGSSSVLQHGRLEDAPEFGILRLLGLTETLIVAHKVARLDGDDRTVKLIAEALRHVGQRLAEESVARDAADRDAAARAG